MVIMKHFKVVLSILVITCSNSLQALENSSASIKSSVVNCSAIDSKSERLVCYDSLAKSLKAPRSASQTLPKNSDKGIENSKLSISKKLASQVLPQNQAESEPVPSVKPGLKEPSNNHEDNFGKKQETVSSSISSRLVGEFKEWQKGQKLKLENGQVWVVKRANRGYKKLQNPMITISEGLFGGFTAQIEGLNATAKVKRVK